MNNSPVILTPKNWVKAGFYGTAPIFIALSIYLLYSFYTQGVGTSSTPLIFDLSLVFSAIIILAGYGTYLPVFHRFSITLDDQKISRHVLKTKSIKYSEITTVVIRNGGIEIQGGGILDRISMGDLYLNFDEAFNFLSKKLKDRDDITYKGSSKRVQEFREGS